jgi:signal transduction histidine kinase/CHASE3 domain sensor protein
MPHRQRLPRAVLVSGFGLAFGFLLLAGLAAWRSQALYQESVDWTQHSYDVLDGASQLLITIQRAEGSARGYAITGLHGFRHDATVYRGRVLGQFRELSRLLADSDEQSGNLRLIYPLLIRRMALTDSLIGHRDRDPRVTPETVSLVVQSSSVGFSLRRAVTRLTETERRLLGTREEETEVRGRMTVYAVTGALGLALLILAAAASLTFQELREREAAEEGLRTDAERQAVMIELQQAIATASADDPAVLDLIVDQVMSLTGAAGAALTFVDGDVHVARTARGDLVPWIGVRNPLADSLTGAVLRSKAPEVINDIWSDARVDRAIADRLGTRSTAILPILSGDAPVGALVVSSQVPNAFDEDDLTALRIMSGILSAGVTNAAAYAANERLLDELRRSRDAAEDASRTKSEFLATMSHELRTPLNSVIGFANLLLKNRAKNLSDQDLQFLGRIRDNGTHLLGLINDILDVSKIEAGKMEVRPVPTDLAPLIRETVSQLGGQQSGRPVELRAEASDGLGSVEVDPARLKQVLINLIGNALKFTEKGSVTVRLAAEAGRPVRIDVTDTGIGIPADRLDAIFDAFTQAEATTERRYGGTGLGLTISRSLLRLMGADLSVTSTVGAGSTFSIILPKGGADQGSGSGTGPLVLVVDDDVHTRQLLSALLAAEGYRFTTAREGRDALAILAHERPRLILLDLKMPVMNGREFLRALRGDPRYAGIPVVVVTSLDRDDPELEGIPAQVSTVLSKGPALEQALPELLRTLIRD